MGEQRRVFCSNSAGNRDVHPSPQATNITISGNLPNGPPPPPPPPPPLPPSNRTAFCTVGDVGPCLQELKGAEAVASKCSADFEHVEQHILPPHSVSVEALHVDVQGNGHTDVAVVGVIYSDDGHGRPGQLLATSDPVLVKAHAERSFVRLPFPQKGGVPITPRSAGETVWLGEQAGKPTTTARIIQTGSGGNATEPPGPLDLACFGFPPSAPHRPCMYTPQPFASKPKPAFAPATTCSNSISVFATVGGS